MTPVILFDDSLADLGPLSDIRATFEQRTGALTAIQRWQMRKRLTGVVVPFEGGRTGGERTMATRAFCARMARAGVAVTPKVSEAILVNGRFDIEPEEVEGLQAGGTLTAEDGSVVAARRTGAAIETLLATMAAGGPTSKAPGWVRPWHLLDAERFAARLAADFELILAGWASSSHGNVPSWAAVAGRGGVHVHATAKIGANAVLDSTGGPILLDEGSEVRHGAILIGPVYVGPGSIVAERAHIKARTSIGPHCRIGGEVGSVIVQGFSNKVHDGHLGDALLGEWVNLGAGTVNSNLLNTYGEITMRLRPSSPLERTGRQFMGCLIGDHVKTAIGTRIMTGCSVGVGTMWAASAPITGAVGPFRWVTDDGERMYQLEKFVQLARTVMGRRHLDLDVADEGLLRYMLNAELNACGSGARA